MNFKSRIPISKNLFLDEYFPKDMYINAKNDIELMAYLDYTLVVSDQLLRDKFGRVIINNWFIGGNRQYSGFRPKDCPIGAKFSDHKKGFASDKIFQYEKPEIVRKFILTNYKTLFITKIEIDVSWVHTSVVNTNSPNLILIRP